VHLSIVGRGTRERILSYSGKWPQPNQWRNISLASWSPRTEYTIMPPLEAMPGGRTRWGTFINDTLMKMK
jgi:hypothetical protein